jgi:selenium donor protein
MGKLPVDIEALGVDMLSIAGHKLYAPKGVGALYLRTGIELDKIMFGANHEADRRPGTENVLEIVGLGKAAEIAQRDLETNLEHFTTMRDRLHESLQTALPEGSFLLNGHPDLGLENTLSLAFHRIEANTFLAEIGDRVAASAGAACHTDEIDLSHVLEAMQVPIDYAMGTVRFSVGRHTTAEEIDRAVEIMVKSLRPLLPESASIPASGAEADLSEIKLTHFTAGLGCACKLRPQALEKILANLPPSIDPNALVDASTNDDAAVYQVNDDLAVVQTVDFFTPIIDDPYAFGAISAANSLSDIYAMGARPIFALNIVGFPSNRLPLAVLEEILRGAQDKAAEAGIAVLGGHTVDDNEPKFGMAVTGLVAPENVIRNSTAQPGDALILTKPLGLGILTTALKQGLVDRVIESKLISVMAALNRDAAESMAAFDVHACTDVTGFGLLGHLREMTEGAGVTARIAFDTVPILPEARKIAQMDVVPGGTLNNLDYVSPFVDFDEALSRVDRILLADAQTSGGLLISLPKEQADQLLEDLQVKDIRAARIGVMNDDAAGRIQVTRS